MFPRYGSLSYVLDTTLLRLPMGRKVRVAKLLAGMSRWPFKPVALTCAGKTDGGGAQVHAVMSVQSFCEAFGYQYVHTAFEQVEHTASRIEVLEWERLFNLGFGEDTASNCGYRIVSASRYVRSPRLWFQKVAVAVEQLHEFSDANPDAYMHVRDRLRRKYTGSPLPREDDRLTIGVHIRRGDITGATGRRRFTSNAAILGRIEAVRRACDKIGRGSRAVIYSQGQPEDFRTFVEHGLELQLDAPPLQSLNAMVQADILLMAKSSFSYVAGLLSAGMVIYEPFWHSPLPDWLHVDHIDTLGERLAR
jgi:hypothetical protein